MFYEAIKSFFRICSTFFESAVLANFWHLTQRSKITIQTSFWFTQLIWIATMKTFSCMIVASAWSDIRHFAISNSPRRVLCAGCVMLKISQALLFLLRYNWNKIAFRSKSLRKFKLVFVSEVFDTPPSSLLLLHVIVRLIIVLLEALRFLLHTLFDL